MYPSFLFRRQLENCGAIFMGGGADCDNIPQGGTNARLILFNINDIVSYTTDGDGNITAITLVDDATGYEFTGFRNDMKASEDVIKPDVGIAKFKHTTGLLIYENTQVQKNNVEGLARGRFVAIVEKNGKSDESLEVYGKGVGMEIVAGPIRNAEENGGFFVVSLSTPDDLGLLESKLPQTLKVAIGGADSQYQANLAYITSLIPASS